MRPFDLGEALSRLGFLQSMNRPRRMNDNAHMESFFHSLKTEWLFGMTFQTDSELRAALFDYVRFYNRQRLHSSLRYVPPAVFEAQFPIHTGVNETGASSLASLATELLSLGSP